MKWLHKLRISTKIYLLVGFLGIVAGLVGSAGIVAMRTYDSQVDAITAASTRALLGERVNGLVNAIVMDSRGVYMAENKERVEQFGKPLLENLKRMDGLLAQWRPLVPPSQMEQFQRAEQHTAEFIAFRTKLVELGRTEGAAAAREWGDNDANRTNRQALNKELQGIAAQNAELISTGSAELQEFYGTMLTTLVLLTVLGVGIAAAFAFLMVRMTVTRPLADITSTMKRLAEGDAGVTVNGLDRGDEIGEMARTIGVFRDNMERAATLEQQRRTDEEAREQRRLNLERLTHDFGAGIDKVVEAVSAQAAEMRELVDRHVGHRRGDVAPVRRRRGGIGRGAGECPDRGVGGRGTGKLDRRDRPAGRRVLPHRHRGRDRGRADQRERHQPCRGGRKDRRGRQSDQRHRQPDQPAGAERHDRGGARRAKPARASPSWRRR